MDTDKKSLDLKSVSIGVHLWFLPPPIRRPPGRAAEGVRGAGLLFHQRRPFAARSARPGPAVRPAGGGPAAGRPVGRRRRPVRLLVRQPPAPGRSPALSRPEGPRRV